MKEDIKNVKHKLNTFIGETKGLEFGDYILFQEYKPDKNIESKKYYTVSKPILGIYLGMFVADQTIGFNYVRWNNDKHTVYVTNEYVTNYPTMQEVEQIEQHIEWDDYIDILGHWKRKPNWKEIIKSYRQQNLEQNICSDEIDWEIVQKFIIVINLNKLNYY